MQGKKKYNRGVWAFGVSAVPISAACEPPQVLSSADIQQASLWLCAHKAVSLRARVGFRHLLRKPHSCPAPSSQHDFLGLICFPPSPGLCCAQLPKFPHACHCSPWGPALFNICPATWHSSGRLLKALYKCSAGKHPRPGV